MAGRGVVVAAVAAGATAVEATIPIALVARAVRHMS